METNTFWTNRGLYPGTDLLLTYSMEQIPT